MPDPFVETVFASVAAGVVVYDTELRYVVWNRFMEELTGVPAEQVQGQSTLALFPQLREHGVHGLLRRALAGETVRSPDMRFEVPQTGRTIWVVAKYSPHVNADGKTMGVVATIHDITERKRSEQRFRSIIENASDMIAIVDGSGRTIYESPSNERILGYKPEELVGSDTFDLVHPQDRERVEEAFSRTVEYPGTSVTMECRYRHKDGSWRTLEATGKSFLHDPAVGGVVINSRDITERRALEAQLRSAQLLALELQIQPHFLFNALNAIVAQVHEQPDTAESMIVQLSDFLRLVLRSAGQQEVPLARELDLLDHYMGIQRARFGERLRVQQDIAPEALDALVPPLILQPLVENALTHGLERAGEGCISIRAARHDSTLTLSVEDNGAGLRSSGATRGEGIGLANIQSRLAQIYAGAARMELGEGADGGALVVLTLPFRAGDPPPRQRHD